MIKNRQTPSSIIIKSSDFKYPTKEERKQALIGLPNLKNFGFKEINEVLAILGDNIKMEEVKRSSDLFQWDNCLVNKIGKMCECYIYLTTNFNRGISEFDELFAEDDHINSIQFDFYIESFYYFFYSTRDIIGQILNVFCYLNISEDKVIFNKLGEKILDTGIRDIIDSFILSTTETSQLRNSFTHKFTPTNPDFRSKIMPFNDSRVYSPGSGGFNKPKEFMKNISESLKMLDQMINDLRIEFKKAVNPD